ncbi:MAG: sigma-E processing peptidase SpoIIGA [Lachnospiraceae bacterium]|nr:sigma-E processing peptidase SpoIIGA [Lachnospiraceae bacterium]
MKGVRGKSVFYADVFLLVHFFFEYILLKIVQMFLGGSKSRLRLLAGAALGGSVDTLLFLCPVPPGLGYLINYLLVPLLELSVCFRLRSPGAYVKAMMVLYLTALCMGGFLNWLCEQIPFVRKHGMHLMTFIIAVCFWGACLHRAVCIMRTERRLEQCIRQVELTINGKQIHCSGLMDTGNSLYDPISRKPVLILERGELFKNQITIQKQQYRVIPYHSLGTKRGVLEGFVANEVSFTEEDERAEGQVIRRQNVVIGIYEGTLSKDGAYQMILHPML